MGNRELCKFFYTTKNSELDLAFFTRNGILKIFKAENQSSTYILLQELKNKLNSSGVFQYRDMYAFAEKLLIENPNVKLSLRKRFPFVFVDEDARYTEIPRRFTK